MSIYRLHQYLDADGQFDYERYRAVQQKGNKQKIKLVWASEPHIAFLARYIERIVGEADRAPQFGICHGTRRGKEQAWFRDYLPSCEVIGTEISDTATKFPHTIQWDFHDVKPEWIGATDFIYSNSLDHSYDPENCLNAWMSCIRPGGICIIEHTDRHGEDGSSEMDPFGAELIVMPYLIARWGRGNYHLREMIDDPAPGEKHPRTFLIVQNCV